MSRLIVILIRRANNTLSGDETWHRSPCEPSLLGLKASKWQRQFLSESELYSDKICFIQYIKIMKAVLKRSWSQFLKPITFCLLYHWLIYCFYIYLIYANLFRSFKEHTDAVNIIILFFILINFLTNLDLYSFIDMRFDSPASVSLSLLTVTATSTAIATTTMTVIATPYLTCMLSIYGVIFL